MNRIKELRIARDMTLKEVASRIGVSESTMQRYETGEIRNLKYDTAVALANVFGVSPQYLLGWSDMLMETIKNHNLDSISTLLGINDFYEERLITIYRDLNSSGKDKLLEYAELLANADIYKKCDSVEKEA